MSEKNKTDPPEKTKLRFLGMTVEAEGKRAIQTMAIITIAGYLCLIILSLIGVGFFLPIHP